MKDSSANILRIAEFDVWLMSVFPFDTQPPKYRIEKTVGDLQNAKGKMKDSKENIRKHQWLVVSDGSISLTKNQINKELNGMWLNTKRD
eukprot:31088-Ditylum_brightwellii.AAC.1